MLLLFSYRTKHSDSLSYLLQM